MIAHLKISHWLSLVSACEVGNIERAKAILAEHPQLLARLNDPLDSDPTEKSDRLLHKACVRDDGYQREVVELLVSKGADINALGRYGQTPLIEACYTDCLNTAKMLIDLGADVACRDDGGMDAFEADGSGVIEAYHASFLARQDIARAISDGFGGDSAFVAKPRDLSL